MKYLKANEVFPEHLLEEIQKYVQGELIYIPNQQGQRKKWGEASGHRDHLIQRNNEIRQKHQQGISIDRLSVMYFLSLDSIKKIVYTKMP